MKRNLRVGRFYPLGEDVLHTVGVEFGDQLFRNLYTMFLHAIDKIMKKKLVQKTTDFKRGLYWEKKNVSQCLIF